MENREIICNKCREKEYIICSKQFETFYVKHNYHYDQYSDSVIEKIIMDIKKIKNK